MCLLVIKPEGCSVDKEDMRRAMQTNSHGAGFVSFNEKKKSLYMHKGFFEFERFWAAYEPHQHQRTMIHFRLVSQGKIEVENCHPFYMSGGHYLAHNGHMSEFTYAHEERSDTRYMVDNVLNPILKGVPRALWNDDIIEFIEMALSYQKIAIMRSDGEVLIFNRSNWTQENGIYFSNMYHRPKAQYLPTNNYATATNWRNYNTVQIDNKTEKEWEDESDKYYESLAKRRLIEVLGNKNQYDDIEACDICGDDSKYKVCQSCYVDIFK